MKKRLLSRDHMAGLKFFIILAIGILLLVFLTIASASFGLGRGEILLIVGPVAFFFMWLLNKYAA